MQPAVTKDREYARRRVLIGGKLVWDDGAFTADCAVKDISESGARIQLGPRESIPARVYFLELKSGLAYEADVVWRRSPQFGLRFVRRIDLDNPPRELRGLERLRAVLRH